MTAIAQYLTDDHHHCDTLFAGAETTVAAGDWATAQSRFEAFRQATLTHLAREEEVLFPDFEARTGMTGGPTAVMRAEHVQIQEALQAMAEALVRRDADGYLGLSETLLMLTRQHNMKEEQILYPMADQALEAQAGDLVERMRRKG
jgi:iron-sulfur cluster repair protein YtfE (RIC family)